MHNPVEEKWRDYQVKYQLVEDSNGKICAYFEFKELITIDHPLYEYIRSIAPPCENLMVERDGIKVNPAVIGNTT